MRSSGRATAAWLVAIAAVMRLAYLTQPMRYDESVAYVYFAARSWWTVLSSYRYPNNQVFYTLQMKLAAVLFGPSPWSLRLPAFIAGIVVVVLTFRVGRRLVPAGAEYFGMAIAAVAAPLVLFSTNARGYMFITVATLVLVDAGLRLRERFSLRDWSVTVVVAVLALWTNPAALYPVGSVALWFAASSWRGETSDPRRDSRAIAIAMAATAALTGVLYLPIIHSDGLTALTSNRAVAPSTWPDFFFEVSTAIPESLRSWSAGLSAAGALVFVVLAVVGWRRVREMRRGRTSLAGAAYVWCAALLLVTHRVPPTRTWIVFLPLAGLLVGTGIVRLFEWRRHTNNDVASARTASVPVAIALAAIILVGDTVGASSETGTVPDARAMARFFKGRLQSGDRVLAPIPTNGPLLYYFLEAGVDTATLSTPLPQSRTVYLVVAGRSAPAVDLPTVRALRDTAAFAPPRVVSRFRDAQVLEFRRKSSVE